MASPPEEFRNHPGFVDSKSFASLAGNEDALIEINISGALLRLAGAAFKKDEPELYSFLTGIQSIHAVVVEAADDSRAASAVDGLARNLNRDGWDRIALVRDEEEVVHVYVHSGKDVLDGLTVLVHHPGEETIFANIAGAIDLAMLAELGDKIDIPGLNQLGGGKGRAGGIYVVPSPAPEATPHSGKSGGPAPRAERKQY